MEHFRTANTALGIWNTYFHDPVIANSSRRLSVWRYCPQQPPRILIIFMGYRWGDSYSNCPRNVVYGTCTATESIRTHVLITIVVAGTQTK
jgi:hypothetical protein